MNKYSEDDLKVISKKLRKKIIEISYKNRAHHIGSELSCIDLMSVLFNNYINLNSKNIFEENSDIFILSKGHAALAYYILLAEKKFFTYEYLSKNFLSNGGIFGGHPDYNVHNSVQINSGSLGYGIALGSGFALIAKKNNLRRKTYVLIGDGECNEGSIWESILFACHHNLNNLIIIVDKNQLQGLGKTNEVVNTNSLDEKFLSFGCETFNIDGHNILEIDTTLSNIIQKNDNLKPKVIIASTIKGKGIKSMEGQLSSHYETLTEERFNEIILELDN